MRAEKFPPAIGIPGQAVAEQRPDLLPALLEAGANERFGCGRENERSDSSDEVEQVRLDVGTGEETCRRDLVARSDFVGRLQKHRNRAERLRAWPRAIPLRRFLLEHQHHAGGKWPGEDFVDPRGCDGVRKISDDFESEASGGVIY